MKIKINNQILECRACTSFSTRFWGMMLQKKKLPYGLYFPKCSSIHTFFMKQPIDLIMVNENNQIIDFYTNLRPWKIVRCKRAKACYEFSCNILEPIKIGTKISIQ